MKNLCTIVLVLLTLGLALPATAQQRSDKRVKIGRTVYDFDEVDILGQLKKPVVGNVAELPEIRFRQLLNLDESFIPEIVRSVDEF